MNYSTPKHRTRCGQPSKRRAAPHRLSPQGTRFSPLPCMHAPVRGAGARLQFFGHGAHKLVHACCIRAGPPECFRPLRRNYSTMRVHSAATTCPKGLLGRFGRDSGAGTLAFSALALCCFDQGAAAWQLRSALQIRGVYRRQVRQAIRYRGHPYVRTRPSVELLRMNLYRRPSGEDEPESTCVSWQPTARHLLSRCEKGGALRLSP